jgi:hypothetical protein
MVKEIWLSPVVGNVIVCPPSVTAEIWYTLNQTFPLPSQFATSVPVGALAMYTFNTPAWYKLLGFPETVKPTVEPAATETVEAVPDSNES